MNLLTHLSSSKGIPFSDSYLVGLAAAAVVVVVVVVVIVVVAAAVVAAVVIQVAVQRY